VRIYTRTGDSGETALFGGGRVSKDHVRVRAYGEVDELNSSIGVAMAADPLDVEAALLETIQRDLFPIGGRLARPKPENDANAKGKAVIPEERIT
jgi:cob(I)alamin adenosyltransferase